VNDIRSRVAYLQGLAEGLDLDTGSPEGRVLSSMLDVLVDLADEIQEVVDAQEELAEYVEDVDYDLGALEETVFGDEHEDDTRHIHFVPEGMLTEAEDGMELTICPECGDTLAAGAGEIETNLDVVCPGCGCQITRVGTYS